jgi:SHS2 domain-containing protein
MKTYTIIDHTADVGIEAYGKTPQDIFVNMAQGMFGLITNLKNVNKEKCFNININGEDKESLLISWLNELIYLFDTEKVILKEFKIEIFEETKLKAKVCGEKINLDKHVLEAQIKAATYHMLKFEHNQQWKATVIFDV